MSTRTKIAVWWAAGALVLGTCAVRSRRPPGPMCNALMPSDRGRRRPLAAFGGAGRLGAAFGIAARPCLPWPADARAASRRRGSRLAFVAFAAARCGRPRGAERLPAIIWTLCRRRLARSAVGGGRRLAAPGGETALAAGPRARAGLPSVAGHRWDKDLVQRVPRCAGGSVRGQRRQAGDFPRCV